MNGVKVVEMVEDIAFQAEHLKEEVAEQGMIRPSIREIQSLRRALDSLEQELLDPVDAVVGDAC